MSILGLVLFIVILGIVAWLINTYLPLPAPFKTIILVILIVVAVVVTLNAFGLLGSLNTAVPHLR